MDGGRETRNLEAWKEAVEMRSKRLRKNVKWRVLHGVHGDLMV